MHALWTEKFFPKSFDEFVGNVEIAKEAAAFASGWENGKPQKPLLLFGQSGAGKTCLAHLTAALFGWAVFELNASDFRSKEIIERL